jgi:hypothetical protein
MASGNSTRLLIATGGVAADTDELPSPIRELVTTASESLVVAPILTTRLQWLANDTDRARFEADERLKAVLSHVEAIAPDTPVGGQIGDEEPLSAFDDAIRLFRPDHILVALRSAETSGWQEQHLLERILERFHLPITVFELDRAGRLPAGG